MTTYATREEAVEAAKAKSAEMLESLETVDFDGQNCEDAWDEGANCDGWDGNDRRCGCGNRRVGWAFTNYNNCWQYYAEAW